MNTVKANGIEICYEEAGSRENPTLLLVNGFTSQLVGWEPEFIDALVDEGFHVVRFDNRDTGLTTKSEGEPPAYALSDMADDGMALLTELGIDKAHIAGASMGGMIVQRMAIRHPERVLSMTSIMSTTGDRSVGAPKPEAMEALLTPPPTDRDEYLAHNEKTWKLFSGPHYTPERARDRAARSYDRCFNPKGAAYQMAAIMADGDRTAELADLKMPVLVIHGKVDPLVGVSGGEATAKAIPGAELLILDDMGHDMPIPRSADIAAAIAKVAARASA